MDSDTRSARDSPQVVRKGASLESLRVPPDDDAPYFSYRVCAGEGASRVRLALARARAGAPRDLSLGAGAHAIAIFTTRLCALFLLGVISFQTTPGTAPAVFVSRRRSTSGEPSNDRSYANVHTARAHRAQATQIRVSVETRRGRARAPSGASSFVVLKRPSARRGPGIVSVDRNVRSKCRCSCVLQFTS